MPAIHWLIGRETTARLALALALLTATVLVGCEEALEGIDDLDLGGLDIPPVTGTIQPRFETEGVEFLRMPWPSDYRLDDDGRFILDDFPNATSGILGTYVDVVTEEVRGFSTMPVVYVVLDQGPGVESFPSAATTLETSASVQLLDVSEQGCGTRIPIEVRFELEGDDYRPINTLMAAPVPGFSLEPSRPYALVLRRAFGLPSGLATERPAGFEGVLEGTHPDARLVAAFEPLVRCLESDELTPDEIAVATVFTTQDPTEETRRVRAVVVDPSQTAAPVVSGWRLDEDNTTESRFRTYAGTYETPIFQRGTTPYASVGGGFRFEEDGSPILQRWETVPFVFTHPTNVDPPYDVLIWSDGTGAEVDSHINGEPVRNALNAGFAVATFQPQFHGDRSGNANPELHTFNIANAEAFRTNFRQQVVDTAYFIRVVREALGGLSGLPALQTDTLVYGGHSQGAIVGALVAGVETELTAYVLNGVGAYLAITAVEREDPFSFNDQIRSFMGIPGILDRFHPVIALIQLGGDVADPINYARYWRGFDGHASGSSLYLINGKLDQTTPQTSVDAMTISGGVQPIRDRGWDVDPFGVWDIEPAARPISANTSGLDGTPLTIATFLSASNGHFTIYQLKEARDLAIEFWETALIGTPELR